MTNLARKSEIFNTPAEQQDLLPADHMRLLHPEGRRGKVSVLTAETWRDQIVPIQELPEIARQFAGRADVYASQQSFYGWRRIIRLAQLGCCYVDLDFHKTPYARCTPEQMAHGALLLCDEESIPTPSLIFSTGRGLLCLWLHTLVPRGALPRWNALQHQLWKHFAHIGADRGALDAARVFRIAGTKNSKSDQLVRPIWMDAPAPQFLQRYDFEDLASEIFEDSRADVHSLVAERAARKAASKAVSFRPATTLTAASLWETRMTDLQRLRQGRWFGDLPSGHRDEWTFLMAVAMSYIAPPIAMRREMYAIAQECGGWSENEAKSRLSAIFRRAQEAYDGITYTWEGKAVDPRYRFKTSTIIERLGITDNEMREYGLRTLVSPEIRRELATSRERERRRRQGAVSRDEFLSSSITRQAPWKQLGMSRATWYRKGKPMPEPSKTATSNRETGP